MTNVPKPQQSHRFHFQLFMQDVRAHIAQDDVTLLDHTETAIVIHAFEFAQSAIGWERLPMQLLFGVCDLCGLKLTDYIDVENDGEQSA